MTPFNGAYATSYQFAIVSTAVSCSPTIFEIFDFEEFLDHEIYVCHSS